MSEPTPFSKVNVGAGGRLTVQQVRAYIRELKNYRDTYPQPPEVATKIRHEIDAATKYWLELNIENSNKLKSLRNNKLNK